MAGRGSDNQWYSISNNQTNDETQRPNTYFGRGRARALEQENLNYNSAPVIGFGRGMIRTPQYIPRSSDYTAVSPCKALYAERGTGVDLSPNQSPSPRQAFYSEYHRGHNDRSPNQSVRFRQAFYTEKPSPSSSQRNSSEISDTAPSRITQNDSRNDIKILGIGRGRTIAINDQNKAGNVYQQPLYKDEGSCVDSVECIQTTGTTERRTVYIRNQVENVHVDNDNKELSFNGRNDKMQSQYSEDSALNTNNNSDRSYKPTKLSSPHDQLCRNPSNDQQNLRSTAAHNETIVRPKTVNAQNQNNRYNNTGASRLTSSRHDNEEVKIKPQRYGVNTNSTLSFSGDSDYNKVVSCLATLESLWLKTEGAGLSEKDKFSKSTKLLEKTFREVSNPWSTAIYLTRNASDYNKAKPASLSYYCIKAFAK